MTISPWLTLKFRIGLGVPAFLNFAFAREQYAFGADEQFINRHAKRLPEDHP